MWESGRSGGEVARDDELVGTRDEFCGRAGHHFFFF